MGSIPRSAVLYLSIGSLSNSSDTKVMTQQVYLRCGWRFIDPSVALARGYRNIMVEDWFKTFRAQKTQFNHFTDDLMEQAEMTPSILSLKHSACTTRLQA
jgi:hypothetical protein